MFLSNKAIGTESKRRSNFQQALWLHTNNKSNTPINWCSLIMPIVYEYFWGLTSKENFLTDVLFVFAVDLCGNRHIKKPTIDVCFLRLLIKKSLIPFAQDSGTFLQLFIWRFSVSHCRHALNHSQWLTCKSLLIFTLQKSTSFQFCSLLFFRVLQPNFSITI